MAKYTSKVTSRGQVTIPSELRRAMGIKPKDSVSLEPVDGGIKISPAGAGIAAGYGAVTPRARPEDFGAIRREVLDEWGDRRRAAEELLSMEVPLGTLEEARDAIARGKLSGLEAD